MAGIYIHVPFCKRACHYCNFHFSTSLKSKNELVRALSKELELRKDFLGGEPIETIYFGGGTPSLLEVKDLELILNTAARAYSLSTQLEITLEANPDDLTQEKLLQFRKLSMNRLSIGVQSFFDDDLKWMNRVHNAKDAERSILLAKEAGFENISVDLIYGSPTTTEEMWHANLGRVVQLGIPHLSCYCLTIEPKTALAYFVKVGRTKAPDETVSVNQFLFAIDFLQENGFDHYEISNFGKPEMYSKHNISYWKGEKYLGIGPSAHSYNSECRYWNVSNNAKYIKCLNEGELPIQFEVLDTKDKYNEYVMTSLRTMWGCDLQKVKRFGGQFYDYLYTNVYPFIERGLVEMKEQTLYLTKQGKLLADHIEAELFYVE